VKDASVKDASVKDASVKDARSYNCAPFLRWFPAFARMTKKGGFETTK